MNRNMSRIVAGGAAIISAFALAGKALGFVQKLVMAYFFGTSGMADAFALAYNSLIMVIGQFPPQLLAPFLPVYISVRQSRGDVAARRLAGAVGVLLALVLSGTVFAGLLMAPRLIGWISQFQSGETSQMAVRLTRLMMPAVFFMGLMAYGTLLCHAEKRFARPAFAETIQKLTLIVGLLLLGRWLGIQALGVGVVMGAVAGFGVIVFGLRGRVVVPREIGQILRDPDLLRWLTLTGPLLAGVVVAQIRTVLDNRFASAMATGSVAGLQYARGLSDTLVLLVPSAVGVAIYPVFSEMTDPAQRAALGGTVFRVFRAMMFLLLPVSLLLIVLREPIIQLLFQRGKFGSESVALTAWPLVFYGAGLPIFAVEILLMRLYYALKNTWFPTLVGAVCVGLHVWVIMIFREELQHGSMALAALVSKGVKVAVLWGCLGYYLHSLEGRQTVRFVIQSAVALMGMGLAVWGVRILLEGLGSGLRNGGTGVLRLVWLVGEVMVSGGIGIAVYLVLGWAVRVKELSAVAEWIPWRRRFRQKEAA